MSNRVCGECQFHKYFALKSFMRVPGCQRFIFPLKAKWMQARIESRVNFLSSHTLCDRDGFYMKQIEYFMQ